MWLTGVEGKDLSLGWHADAASRRPLGNLDVVPGGVGVLGLGVVPVAVAAVLLARRNQFVLALASGSGAFLIAALVLQYDPAGEVTRMDGHARNFALLALLVALGIRLNGAYGLAGDMRPLQASRRSSSGRRLRAQHAAWPWLSAEGYTSANAQQSEREFDEWVMGRAVIKPLRSERIAAYIRNQTAVDARVFSPHPHGMTVSTGRPNASGFPTLIHLFGLTGAEYEDTLRFLEPAAVRRLGFKYLHAPDIWVEGLPDRAKGWLQNPELFELLVRDGADALYRIQPAFLRLDSTPAPQSYEALRRAVPDRATVHVPTPTSPLSAIRVASVLPHARILGTLDPQVHYSLTEIPTQPSNGSLPDIVVVERNVSFDISTHQLAPIWWNHVAVAYATRPSIGPAIAPAPRSETQFSIRVADVHATDGRITFTATFSDHAPEQWTGQDWLLVQAEDTPWGLPADFESDGYTLVGTRWFAGQISPNVGTTTHTYRFDAGIDQLSVQDLDGEFIALAASGNQLTPGIYILAARLRLQYLQAAIIPVLKVVISETGTESYTVDEGERRVSVKACTERLRIAVLGGTLCRHRATEAESADSP